MDYTANLTPYLSLFSALSYGAASMAMVFINKAVVMQYAHSMSLLTLQQLATALLIHFGRVMGYTKARGFDIETAKRLMLVSIFYNANVAFALASLKGVNIPMYIAIKRLTPLAVLIAGFFYGKGRPTTQVTLSVMLIAVGVLIAALGDFSFDPFAYTLAFTSVFFQTMYLVLVEKSEYLTIIFGGSSSFPGDGHSSELHDVLVYDCQLCFNYYYSWRPQGGRFHSPWLFRAGRGASARCEHCWTSHQHCWWFVVLIREISTEEKQVVA